MVYVLIIVTAVYGGFSTQFHEFVSLERCEAAKTKIIEAYKAKPQISNQAFCLQK